jgi:nucleotide-binding universal stress UspA family protein
LADQLSSIVVPLDGSDQSEQAIPYAIALAGQGGKITLLQVVPEAEPLRKPFGAITMTAEEVVSMLIGLANEDLDRAEANWASLAGGIAVSKRAIIGDAADAILATADELNADAIVMASAGRGAIGRLTLGSVADRVVRSAERPVLVVREADTTERALPNITRVVVPLDGSDRAELALPVAAAVSREVGASVELISAVDLPQVVSPSLGYAPAFAPEFYTEMEKEATGNAEKHLDEAIGKLGESGVTATKHISLGSAVHSINDIVKPGDLIVMTSRGQGGFKRWLLGSVAEKLVRESPAPVLLVPSHHHD